MIEATVSIQTLELIDHYLEQNSQIYHFLSPLLRSLRAPSYLGAHISGSIGYIILNDIFNTKNNLQLNLRNIVFNLLITVTLLLKPVKKMIHKLTSF